MEPSLYAGRKVQKHILKSFLTQAFAKAGAPGDDSVAPKVFLLYGNHGLGKTSMIDLCIETVSEIPLEKGKTAITMLLDVEAGRFLNGGVPKTPRAMLDSIYTVALAANQKVADALEPYGSLNQKISDIEKTCARYIKEEWPYEVFLSGNPHSAGNTETALRSWLETRIDPGDLQLIENPIDQLTTTLAECLGKLSKKNPLVFCIDGFELATDPDLEFWFTSQLLPTLTKDKFSITVIFATANPSDVRSLRNKLREETLYTVPLAEMPLTSRDIASIAEQRGIPLDNDHLEEIAVATVGVPLIVQVALDTIRMNVPLGSMLSGSAVATSNAVTLLQEVVTGFAMSQDDETAKYRIFSLAMLFCYNEDILIQLWKTDSAEIETTFSALNDRYSFVRGKHLHGGFRDKLRFMLITEAAAADSPLSTFFANFAAVNSSYYLGRCAQLSVELPDAAGRFADRNFQTAILGVLSSLMWSSQTEAMKLLPGYFTEAVHYNAEFAAVLLGFAEEFLPLMTPESLTIIDSLRAVLPVAGRIAGSPLVPGNVIKANTLDALVKFESVMTDVQKGLLARMKGIIACSSGDFNKGLAAFNKSAGHFGAATAEQSPLFEDYLCVGFAFVKKGEPAKTVEALSKALTIKADDFHAWNELARAHQALGNHEAAIESYVESVKIKSDAVDSWFELGNEYVLLGDYANAVDSFTCVTQLKPDQASAWLQLGLSLEALSRFPEALAALGKVTAMVPDNWETYFALGRAQVGQELQQEAIGSFKKVVELKPDCTDAWKALGAEQYTAGSFEEAAVSLEKAAELEGNDYGLWNAIGKAWHGANNYENAVRACVKAVELDANCVEAWITLGQCHTELSNFKEASASFARASELNPNDPEIWVSVGNCLYAQGKFDEAIAAFIKATKIKPDAENIWHNIGLAYQIQNRFVEAIEAYHKEVAINPNIYETWYQQGRAYAELNQHDESAECFAKAVELMPDSHDAWYRNGLSLAKAGNNADAIPSFIKAAELYRGDADIWYQLGLAYAANGNVTEAVESFMRSLSIADNRPEVHYQLGLARESLGLYDDAIASCQKAVELAPEKAEAWLHIGTCMNFQNNYEEALTMFRKTLELAPDNNEVLLPMAHASHAVGNYDDAVSLYQQVINNDPEAEDAWLNLALVHHAMNNIEEALKTYHSVIQKWPGKDQAWHNMGLIYHTNGDLLHAKDSYREAARLNPGSVDSWYQLGIVYYSTGQYGDAIQAFRKVTVLKPDKYEAWFNLGNAYLIWNENDEAIAAYNKALEIKPDDFATWGYLGSACYAIKAYDKAVEATGKALELKSDEPWIMSTRALAQLMTGDPASADTTIETLRATDTSGQEIAKTIGELQKIMALRPDIAGTEELLQKLAG